MRRTEDGALCIQVSLGPYEATLPLPAHIESADEERREIFFQNVVPEMVKGLQKMAAKDRRKLRRKPKQ